MLIEVPELEEVSVRLDPDPRASRGPAEPAEPIPDVLRLGTPIVVSVTPETAEAEQDAALATFLRSQSAEARFARVHLGCTFVPGDQLLVSATLGVDLARVDGVDDPMPIAWSLTPMRVARAVSSTTTLTLGGNAKFAEASVAREKTREHEEVFLEALGLQEPRLGWEFSRTESDELRGTYQLAAVIRLPAGSKARGRVSLTANVKGRRFLLISYRAALGETELAEFSL